MAGQFLPTGAGRAIIDRRNDPLHQFTLDLTGKDDPSILFLPTATGDNDSYIVSFYETYTKYRCRPSHLRLFHREIVDLRAFILGFDIIHVGGGNTANMLDVWRRQGVDEILGEAYQNGAVMTGGSAGGICWFEGGTTDSFGPILQVLPDGLGLLPGSFCPHYDAEDQRQPLFHQALLDGTLPAGYATWNRVALHFIGQELQGAVSSEQGGQALKVFARDGQIVEEAIPTRFLETTVHSDGAVAT